MVTTIVSRISLGIVLLTGLLSFSAVGQAKDYLKGERSQQRGYSRQRSPRAAKRYGSPGRPQRWTTPAGRWRLTLKVRSDSFSKTSTALSSRNHA